MNGTDTLEYGYRTGRQDPESTSLRPASEPPPRNVAPSQQEGRQAEKVIKGLFTGNFNFAAVFNAPPNKTTLTLTGSMSGVGLPSEYIKVAWLDGVARTVVKWEVTGTAPNPSNQNYLELWRPAAPQVVAMIRGDGSFVAGHSSIAANFVGYTFGASIGFMGLGYITGTRIGLYVGGGIICEFENATPNDLTHRVLRLYDSDLTAPQLARNGEPFTGICFDTPGFGDAQVSFVQGGLRILSARKVVAQSGASWALLQTGTGSNITRAGAGTHPRFSLLELHAMPNDSVGANVTDATTLYIAGAPNTTVTGAKRAIWVRQATGGGLVEFEDFFKVTVANYQATLNASVALITFTGTITEFSSGNHVRLSLIEFGALGVTAGAATVADATTVYIAGAPAAVVTGKNRALWVVAGESEFGGIVTVALDRGLRFVNQTNQAAAAVGTLNNAPAAGDPAVWVPIMVAGVNRAVPAW